MMKKGSFHEYAYSVGDEEGLVITGYSGNKTRPAIPKKVNGTKVTGIGNSAFYGCHSLITAKIPKSVSSIGNSAFYGCHSLIKAEIPKSVTSIGNSAFSNCRSLSKITIPEHVSHIGIFAFNGCRNLTDITVDKRNSTYDSRDHCNAIIATKTNQLIVGCCNTKIPDSVSSIGDRAFSGCRDLKEISIPEGVSDIGDFAFEGCTGLTEITLPESVTAIGNFAFERCRSLTNLVLPVPDGMLCIKRNAFKDCFALCILASDERKT